MLDRIHLAAINQSWEVIYLPTTQQSKIRLITNPCRKLTLVGDTANSPLCFKVLRQWLKMVAHDYLIPELSQLSKEVGFTFKRVSIRNNQTRWGSCSSCGHINLCCKVLFLPPLLMRHVLLHELCHTKVMHHGREFWALLEQLDSLAASHAKQLKLAAADIPRWV
jgi:hypothetical protein